MLVRDLAPQLVSPESDPALEAFVFRVLGGDASVLVIEPVVAEVEHALLVGS